MKNYLLQFKFNGIKLENGSNLEQEVIKTLYSNGIVYYLTENNSFIDKEYSNYVYSCNNNIKNCKRTLDEILSKYKKLGLTYQINKFSI